jgi:hypothetical protein
MPKPAVHTGCFFFCIILASLFFPACTIDPVQTDLLVPVDFSNVPDNMVLTDFHTDKIEIKVEAVPGKIEEIKSQNTRYLVDLYTDLAFDPAGDFVFIEPGEYLIPVETNRIPMGPGIRIISTNPSSLSVKLEKKIKKTFKIKVPYVGQPAKGYRALTASTEPSSIELAGAFSVIHSITELKTKPIDLTDINESFKKKIPLDLQAPSILPDPVQLVTVSVPIQEIMVLKTIENLSIQVKNTDKTVHIKPSDMTIEIKGPFESLGNQELIDTIYAFMDLKNLTPGVYARHAYIHIPAGLIMTQASPQVFTVKIE